MDLNKIGRTQFQKLSGIVTHLILSLMLSKDILLTLVRLADRYRSKAECIFGGVHVDHDFNPSPWQVWIRKKIHSRRRFGSNFRLHQGKNDYFLVPIFEHQF